MKVGLVFEKQNSLRELGQKNNRQRSLLSEAELSKSHAEEDCKDKLPSPSQRHR